MHDLDLSGMVLTGATLVGVDLSNANLASSNLEHATILSSVLDGANLERAQLKRATFADVDLARTDLSGTLIEGVSFNNCTLRLSTAMHGKPWINATVLLCDARGFGLIERLEGTRFIASDLRDAIFSQSDLTKAQFSSCNLVRATFWGATLRGTHWSGCRIGRRTRFEGANWDGHNARTDGSDQLSFSILQKLCSWNRVRFLSRIPLFSGAYFVLLSTLVIVSGIELLNETEFVQSLNYPVATPERATPLLVGSALLSLAATFFVVFCPARVLEFSRVRWVEELGRPGMVWEADNLGSPIRTLITLVCLVLGGSLVGIVFIERLFQAVTYSLTQVGLW